MIQEKMFDIEGKRVFIKQAPATVGYDVALRYREALGDVENGIKGDVVEIQNCLYELLKYAELDLGDGRRLPLTSKEVINQHFTEVSSIMMLQKAVAAVNFHFLANGETSAS